MERRQTTTTTTSSASTSRNTINLWIWLGIIAAIIIVLVGSFLIYWFLFRKPPAPKNLTCNGQTCSNGQYCNSAGQCVSGSGENAGSPCCKNGDCVYGYNCVSGYCLANNITPTTNLPPQFNLSIIWGKETYYLDPINSQLTQIPLSTSFSYDPVNQILTINGSSGNKQISTTPTGSLIATTVPYPLTLINNQGKIQIRHPCGSILSYTTPSAVSPQTIPVYFPHITGNLCPSTFQNVVGTNNIDFTPNPVTS